MRRTECGRRTRSVRVEGVEIRVKQRIRPESSGDARRPEARDLFPEDDDLRELVTRTNWSYLEARRRCVEAALSLDEDGATRSNT